MILNGNEMELFCRRALEQGIELPASQLDLFQIYLDELWAWNQRMNLTGLATRERITIELFLDSLIPASYLPEVGRMLDVGSGAGIPGVPLKIHKPSLEVQLLEPNSKKVSFLKQILRLLHLDGVEVIRARLEKDVPQLHSGSYHLITARALTSLPQTILLCAPLLAPGGLLVAFLGMNPDEMLQKSLPIMEKEGITLYRTIPYLLPGKKFERNTLLLKREG